MERPSTPEFPNISPSISNELMMETCDKLSRVITPQDEDKSDDWFLDALWGNVYPMLARDRGIKLTTRDEFIEKAKSYPGGGFIDRVKDVANAGEKSATSWGCLFNDDVFYSTQEDQTLYATESSLHAAVHAWSTDFKGNAANSLLKTITDLLSPMAKTYARTTCIINSSGTGKSRMVDEVSMLIITVPMCLRPHGSQGFPPPDIALREYFEEIGRPRTQERVNRALHGLVYGLLTVTHKQLESLSCDITLSEDLPDQEYVDRFKERQQKLAVAFHQFMTRDQSFGAVNHDRHGFYTSVSNAAKTFNEQCKKAAESKDSPAQYVDPGGQGVRTAGKRLCEFLDPRGLMESNEGRWPLILLSFDDPQVLTDGAKVGEWSLFTELRRILQRLDSRGISIFSLFLSTAGNFRFLSPDIKTDPSSRVWNNNLRPFHPITDISFDCLARPAGEDSVTLFQVVQIDWIAHLGRPLFGSYFDALPEADREDDILCFARLKLLNGKDSLEEADNSGSLACLATRFGLEFNEDEDSRDVCYKQVERHMRICLATTTGFKKLITCSASEPLLAEAAFHLMFNSAASPVKHLANHANLYCIDRGRRGELVAALIIMQARDASLPAHLPQRRWIFVTEFMQALLSSQVSENLLDTLPTHWREGEGTITFRQMFDNCRLWFNHIIKVEDSNVIRPEFLWKYVMRGAMVVCKDNQEGVDIIVPVVFLNGNISRKTITTILIQVKNSKEYGLNINNKLFDAMDPCGLGLLSDHPRPIIRMVFALASPEAGVHFPTRRSREPHHADKFTSFDIWCAGLSTETFQQIGDDLDSYQKLLDRSQLPHDAFNVSEGYNPLSDNTRKVVGRTRRSMAPLVKFSGHDEIHYISE